MRLNISKLLLILIPVVIMVFSIFAVVDVVNAQATITPTTGVVNALDDITTGSSLTASSLDDDGTGLYPGDGDDHVSPVIHGQVVTNTGAPLEWVVWVKWTDKNGQYRYMPAGTPTVRNGYFTFPGWHNIGRSEVERQNNTQIDTDFNGQNDTPQSNNVDGNAFQCFTNPHDFTAVRRVDMPQGSFSTVTANLANFALEQTIDNIVWTPLPPPPPPGLSGSCSANGTQGTLSWQPVDGATSYIVRIDDRADGWDGSCSSVYGDSCSPSITNTSYQFPSTPGHSYHVWAHAIGPGGASGASQTVTFSCPAPDTYTAPTPISSAPSCTNLRAKIGRDTFDPNKTLTLGRTLTLSADFSLTGSGDLWGGIAFGQSPPRLSGGLLPIGSKTYPQDIPGNSGTLTASWTPTSIGTYDVMCNAIKFGVTECRGNSNYTGDPGASVPFFYCGAGATIKVTVTKPGLGPLNIKPGQDAEAKGTYGYSGLRAEQRGSNYYNSLDIKQSAATGTNPSQIKLIGMAFAQHDSIFNPAGKTLSNLMASARAENGFVLVRAGPACGTNCTVAGAGRTFNNGTYYAYVKKGGIWGWQLLEPEKFVGSLTDGIEVAAIKRPGTDPEADAVLEAVGPEFNVRLYQAVGTHTWGTFGYLLNEAGVETIEGKTPTP